MLKPLIDTWKSRAKNILFKLICHVDKDDPDAVKMVEILINSGLTVSENGKIFVALCDSRRKHRVSFFYFIEKGANVN